MVKSTPPTSMGGPGEPELVCHATESDVPVGAIETAVTPVAHGTYTVVPETASPPSTSPLHTPPRLAF